RYGRYPSTDALDAARRARYQLMAKWATERGIGAVLLGHTRDDVTETLLMRLARGAGVDGLSAMASVKEVDGVRFHRPLLSVGREELRDVLRRGGIQWVDDPSNENPQFERVRMRQALAGLSDQGVSIDQLAQSAQALGQARHALNWAVAQFVGDHVDQIAGDLAIAAAPFADLPEELQRRLLTHALLWINGQGYGPRGAELAQFRSSALNGQGATLAGVRMTHRKGAIYLHREHAAVAGLRSDPTAVFDTRWQITGPAAPDHHIAPMGEAGLRSCPNWRDSLRPAAAVMADPAVWRNDQLISAPLVEAKQGWHGELAPFCRDFGKWLVSR
ncbi:MAG: tRNA lysidine(34) synthetase TilS, partial [Thalassovita mediterranea]|uniref:tRNA lysidine(34) synthetase TilS n=1 Tax=Thalassovita mediterranea TaxID=340021 RepID=UPI003C62D5CC